MAPRKRNESICDSSLLTIAVIVPVLVSLFVYRQEPKKLFQILFGVFLCFMVFVMLRHVWTRVSSRWKNQVDEIDSGELHSPTHDRARKEAVSKAQKKHDMKANDYEREYGAPRRERKMQELETKMRSIRGLKDVGTPLGGSAKSSRLLESHDSDESLLEDDSGRWVTINLRLPDRAVKRQFRTSQKVKSLYRWLHSLGYSSEDHCLTTLLPRSPLTDHERSLAEVGLITDTTLAVDERE